MITYITMRHILPKIPMLAGKPHWPDFEKKNGGQGNGIPKFHDFSAYYSKESKISSNT